MYHFLRSVVLCYGYDSIKVFNVSCINEDTNLFPVLMSFCFSADDDWLFSLLKSQLNFKAFGKLPVDNVVHLHS